MNRHAAKKQNTVQKQKRYLLLFCVCSFLLFASLLLICLLPKTTFWSELQIPFLQTNRRTHPRYPAETLPSVRETYLTETAALPGTQTFPEMSPRPAQTLLPVTAPLQTDSPIMILQNRYPFPQRRTSATSTTPYLSEIPERRASS